jgi:hypothetical protein
MFSINGFDFNMLDEIMRGAQTNSTKLVSLCSEHIPFAMTRSSPGIPLPALLKRRTLNRTAAPGRVTGSC